MYNPVGVILNKLRSRVYHFRLKPKSEPHAKGVYALRETL